MIKLVIMFRLSVLIGNIFKHLKDSKKNDNIENIAMLLSATEAIIEVGLFIVLLYLL